ncbi:vWA domain-containing protein [Coleofasciculus sp. G2-EDA-02]|uniref:vWA domain-containing protein n=1 Tax=Coleofasciculus sp. G2-EDA-02 TaxID=3069529 RepID=UPI0033052B96
MPSKNVNVSLIIDTSGSMGMNAWQQGIAYLDFAKTDAATFIYIMKTGDSVGLINFSDNANYLYPTDGSSNVKIDSLQVQDAAVNKIESLSSQNMTNISDGINKGLSLISNKEWPKALILLSDGDWNQGSDPTQNLPPDLPIHTIALGDHGQINVLQTIANKTGGTFHLSPTPFDLAAIYHEIVNNTQVAATIANEQHQILKYRFSQSSAVFAPNASEAIFSINWHNRDIEYTPNPTPAKNQVNVTVVDPNNQRVNVPAYRSGKGFVVFKVPNPQPGEYHSAIWYAGEQQLNCTMGIFDPNLDISLDAQVLASIIQKNDDIECRVRVLDGDEPVKNVTIRMTKESPLISQEEALSTHEERLAEIQDEVEGLAMSDSAKLMALQMQIGPQERIIPYAVQPLTFETSSKDSDQYSVATASTNIPGSHILYVTAEGYSEKSHRPFKLTRRLSIYSS